MLRVRAGNIRRQWARFFPKPATYHTQIKYAGADTVIFWWTICDCRVAVKPR